MKLMKKVAINESIMTETANLGGQTNTAKVEDLIDLANVIVSYANRGNVADAKEKAKEAYKAVDAIAADFAENDIEELKEIFGTIGQNLNAATVKMVPDDVKDAIAILTASRKSLPEAVQDEDEGEDEPEETESSMTIADIMKMFADFQEEASVAFAPIEIDGKEIAITGCKASEGDDGVIEITFDYDMPAAEEQAEVEDTEVEDTEVEDTEEVAETEEITEAFDDITTNVLDKYSDAIEETGEVYMLKASEAAKAKAAVIKAIANFFDLLKAKE